jgi:hypothetical protein
VFDKTAFDGCAPKMRDVKLAIRNGTVNERFIRDNVIELDKEDWNVIFRYQKVSEKFIRDFYTECDFERIVVFQNLNEDFIKEIWNVIVHKGLCSVVTLYHQLSKEFLMDKFQDLYWPWVIKYQKAFREISSGFLKDNFLDHYLDHPDSRCKKGNWLNASTEFKLKYIQNNTDYDIFHDKYIIAYKSVRADGYSIFNFHYKYEVDGVYESNCNCDLDAVDGHGLSAWSRKGALNYHGLGKLFKVKINIEDIGAIVGKGKIRCFKLEVLSEVKRKERKTPEEEKAETEENKNVMESLESLLDDQ